jgi:hypothetical protein
MKEKEYFSRRGSRSRSRQRFWTELSLARHKRSIVQNFSPVGRKIGDRLTDDIMISCAKNVLCACAWFTENSTLEDFSWEHHSSENSSPKNFSPRIFFGWAENSSPEITSLGAFFAGSFFA